MCGAYPVAALSVSRFVTPWPRVILVGKMVTTLFAPVLLIGVTLSLIEVWKRNCIRAKALLTAALILNSQRLRVRLIWLAEAAVSHPGTDVTVRSP